MPLECPGGNEWHQISCGEERTMAVTKTGVLLSWGSHRDEELENDNNDTDHVRVYMPKPVKMFSDAKIMVKHVNCGGHHSAVIASDGSLYTL